MAETGGQKHFVKPYHLEPRIAEYVANHSGPLNPALVKLCQETQKLPGADKMSVYTGASALAAALALPPDGSVVGLEFDEEVVKVGRPFWKEAGVEDKINIIIGDAKKSLGKLNSEFSQILMVT
ncbi:hypothetical protein MTO96_046954 [Rhipicephalus appendiculatus]